LRSRRIPATTARPAALIVSAPPLRNLIILHGMGVAFAVRVIFDP
jgi:hypothetical protein